MSVYDYNISGVVGQTITIDFENIFSNYINDFIAGKIGLVQNQIVSIQSDFTMPYWASETILEDVTSLAFPYGFLNGTNVLTDNVFFLKQIQITPVQSGIYNFYYTVCKKLNVDPNQFNFPFDLKIGKITVSVPVPPPLPTPQTPIPNQPQIPQNFNFVNYDKLIRVEKNVTTNKSFGTDGLYPNGEEIIISSTLPAWITNNTINSRTQTWDITAPSINTYYYYGNVYLRNKFKGSATITLQVVESLFEEIDNCCSDENINIVWLNRQGGRGNFIFTQRRDYKVNIGDKKTYITKDIKRYSEINKVYNATTVYATGLSLNQIDFLDTLRYSIQAWVFVNEVFIPIILDVESFDKYNTKENMYDISISFNYAEQLNIQRQ
jgi:hypothetical protein